MKMLSVMSIIVTRIIIYFTISFDQIRRDAAVLSHIGKSILLRPSSMLDLEALLYQ